MALVMTSDVLQLSQRGFKTTATALADAGIGAGLRVFKDGEDVRAVDDCAAGVVAEAQDGLDGVSERGRGEGELDGLRERFVPLRELEV